MNQDINRLRNGFQDEIAKLIDACHLFDEGKRHQGTTIATSLWVLFGNDGQKSICSQFARATKYRLHCIDSCPPYSPQNLLDSTNLIMMGASLNQGIHRALYLPILDSDIGFAASWDRYPKVSIWWEKKVVLHRPQEKAGSYTRENLVRIVRNNAGSHFSEMPDALEVEYGQGKGPWIFPEIRPVISPLSNAPIVQQAALSAFDQSHQLPKTNLADRSSEIESDALSAQIRQIGHEAIRSFEKIKQDIQLKIPAYNPVAGAVRLGAEPE